MTWWEPVAEQCEHGNVVRSVRRGRRSAVVRRAGYASDFVQVAEL